MYSPHAWTGVVVLVLYFKQVVLGLCLFVFFKDPLSDSPWLTTLSRWHVILGRLALLGGFDRPIALTLPATAVMIDRE